MRGKSKAQAEFCAFINLNERVPVDHPLRGIKQRVDVVLKKLSREFDELYADEGRPSIPPEQLIKSRILINCSGGIDGRPSSAYSSSNSRESFFSTTSTRCLMPRSG